ncbi:MAG TPA: prepilin peptidase [Blastocatellia bacterium]|nr:prepilin peptidase [Blastocatellia bacterium]
MPTPMTIILILLVPITALITYYDVRFRRIPNAFVLATLVSGLIINVNDSGWGGAITSLKGAALAFGLMLFLHIFSAMGAGDVKLFGAIGSVIGVSSVFQTFLVVLVTGGVLALIVSISNGKLRETCNRVLLIFINLFSGWQPPRFPAPTDRHATIPYGVAITVGTLISLAMFHH